MVIMTTSACTQPSLKLCMVGNDIDFWDIDQILWSIGVKLAPSKDTRLIGFFPGFLIPTEKYEIG